MDSILIYVMSFLSIIGGLTLIFFFITFYLFIRAERDSKDIKDKNEN